ncbi:MAG: anthranilate phosphoribosyltransferase [Verrucomicrobiales bacterium]|nr:anthranilate phosphoribosyltransferase [Verrucomicrobiales bacterium]
MLDALSDQVKSGSELASTQISDAVGWLVREEVAPETKADFLTALARRGETPSEIVGFAKTLRSLSVVPPIDEATRARGILDVCGTGGDHQNTFNISTTVAIVVASAGVPVAKHGNRAITSKSGSADVLEALGIPIDLTPDQAAASLRDVDFAFFFAPKFHPAFRHIAPARKLCAQRGQRTIFNFLGPLLNPAQPTAQLVGVPVPSLCAPIATALQQLGLLRGMVVCGKTGTGHLDELSTVGDSVVAEFHHERALAVSTLSLQNLPVQPTVLADLAGGDCAENAGIVRRILAGQERGPKRDAVLLNAGAALFLAGRARGISEGWELAGSLIDSGQAANRLSRLQR